MSHRLTKLICTFFTFSLLLSTPLTVFSNDYSTPPDLGQYIADELNEFSSANNLGTHFSTFSVTTSDCTLDNNEIHESIDRFILAMKQSMLSSDNTQNTVQGNGRAATIYTASVNNTIPAIGWGYIKQDFTAVVNSSKIYSVTFMGESYATGITLGSWDPLYSTYEISNNKLYVKIRMKGVISYLWDAMNISTEASFADMFKANGTTLVEENIGYWPDN